MTTFEVGVGFLNVPAVNYQMNGHLLAPSLVSFPFIGEGKNYEGYIRGGGENQHVVFHNVSMSLL
jgi:hypothetical protein